MKKLTLQEYKGIPLMSKGVWGNYAVNKQHVAPEYLGHRYIIDRSNTGNTFLIEGVDFIIEPTQEELLSVANVLHKRLLKNTIRDFVPCYFSGDYTVDRASLVSAVAREDDRRAKIELLFFELGDESRPVAAWFANYTQELEEAKFSLNTKSGRSVTPIAETLGRLWTKRNNKLLKSEGGKA